MSAEMETTRLVRAWLQEGVTVMPDRVLDAVLEEIPRTRQRRARRTILLPMTRRRVRFDVLLAVALLLVALCAGAIGTGSLWQPVRIRAYPVIPQPLPPGRYAVGPPFVERFAIDIPAGWRNVESGSTTIVIRMTDTSVDDELLFTYVDRVFADPCQPQRGLSPTIGRDAASLVAALTTRLGLDISLPAATEIDGRPATTLVVTAPPDLAACTDARLALWGLPEEHALAVRQVDRLWIVDAPNGRLVISALSSPDTAERSVAAMEGMVTSLRFGVEPELPPPPYSPPPEGAEEPLGFLPPEGPIPKGGYVLRKTLYGYDARGVAAPLPGTYDAVMYVPAGWFPTGNGIADRPTDPTARVGVWTLRSINLDPCHWQTSDTADPPMVRSQASLAEALHAWWTDPSAADGNDDLPFPFAPVTSAPVERPWMSRATPYVDIQIPADLDLATCDGGEYRLWDDHDGRARTAQPGESIRVAVVDMEPGLAVLEYGWTPAASASTRAGLEQSGPDVSLQPTNWRIEHEGTVPQP